MREGKYLNTTPGEISISEIASCSLGVWGYLGESTDAPTASGGGADGDAGQIRRTSRLDAAEIVREAREISPFEEGLMSEGKGSASVGNRASVAPAALSKVSHVQPAVSAF